MASSSCSGGTLGRPIDEDGSLNAERHVAARRATTGPNSSSWSSNTVT